MYPVAHKTNSLNKEKKNIEKQVMKPFMIVVPGHGLTCQLGGVSIFPHPLSPLLKIIELNPPQHVAREASFKPFSLSPRNDQEIV